MMCCRPGRCGRQIWERDQCPIIVTIDGAEYLCSENLISVGFNNALAAECKTNYHEHQPAHPRLGNLCKSSRQILLKTCGSARDRSVRGQRRVVILRQLHQIVEIDAVVVVEVPLVPEFPAAGV